MSRNINQNWIVSATPERFNELRFECGQWAVTDYGLEVLDEDYFDEKFRIPTDELVDVTEGRDAHFIVPVEIAKFRWVHGEQLLEAFEKAVAYHHRNLDPVETEKHMRSTRRLVRLWTARRTRRAG